MALHHLHSGEVANLKPFGGDALSSQSIALFKTSDLEVLRLMLPRGHTVPEHAVEGDVTVQCLEGVIEVGMAPTVQRLCPGQLMFIQGGQPRRLLAIEDGSVLVTIALKPGVTGRGLSRAGPAAV